MAAAAAAKSLQSCLTLWDPIDGSPPGSPIPGILQARTLEWVAISFSKAWEWKVKVKSLSRVLLFVTSWTAAYQASPSMGFSRQEYWSGSSPNFNGKGSKKKTVFKFLTSSSLKSFSVCKVQISSLQRYSVLARGYGNHRQFDLILIIRNLTSDLTGS